MQYRTGPRTEAQRRRRQKRLERRKPARGPYVSGGVKKAPKAARTPRWALRRKLRAAREQAQAFAGDVARRLAALATRQAPRCPYRHESKTSAGVIVLAAACGGRLQRTPAETLLCRTCGREWRPVGPKSTLLERVAA